MAWCLSVFICRDPARTVVYTLSLHDALPIYVVVPVAVDEVDHRRERGRLAGAGDAGAEDEPAALHREVLEDRRQAEHLAMERDRKSTRLNSSHTVSSYAVFCLKKKKSL